MTSKARAKGYRTVAAGKKEFINRGYICGNLERNSKFAKERDLFNLWDYIFIKKKEHVFVQFKTNMKGKAWKKPYLEFGALHGNRYVKYQIWNKIDYRGWEITECN